MEQGKPELYTNNLHKFRPECFDVTALQQENAQLLAQNANLQARLAAADRKLRRMEQAEPKAA